MSASREKTLEGCKLYGCKWNLVSGHANVSKDKAKSCFREHIPEDWKSFSTLPWPDEEILQLVQAIFVHTGDATDWLAVAAKVGKPSQLCQDMSQRIAELSATRLGPFSALEDEILVQRVLLWRPDGRTMWTDIGQELKRHHTQLNSHWVNMCNDK
jgi:hypothetical protein